MNIRYWRAATTALVLLVAVATFPKSMAADEPKAIEKAITSLEQTWNDAYGANDLPKYFSYYSENPILVFYNKRATLTDYRKMWAEETKTEPVASATASDLKIEVAPAGDTAVASYQLEVRTHHPDGKTTTEHAFETDVWFKQKAEWRVYVVHYSKASAS